MVSVILPTFNERESIGILVDDIHKVLGSHSHEIIVVDDNSPDGTHSHLLSMAQSRPFLKSVLRKDVPSLAGSLLEGIKISQGENIILMDSDYNHQPRYLPFMIDSLKYYECVSGSRFLYGGSMNHRTRHMLSWLFNIYVRFITGGKISDNLYGFIAIHRKVLMQVPAEQVYWGFGDYCIRLLYYLQQKNVLILQFPAENGERVAGVGNSKFFKTFIQYTLEALRLAWKERIKCTQKSKDVEFAGTRNS